MKRRRCKSDEGKRKGKKGKTPTKKTSPYERQLYGVHIDVADCCNKFLLDYYRRQGIVPSGEWAAFEQVIIPQFTMQYRSHLI